MSNPSAANQSWSLPSWPRLGLAMLAVLLGVSALGYCALAPDAALLLPLELAGSAGRIQGIQTWVGEHPPGWVEFVFIAGYGAVLSGGAGLAFLLSPAASTRWLARAALVATVVAVVLDIVEHLLFLLKMIGVGGRDVYVVAAQALAITKWSLIAPAAAVAILGIVTTAWRAVTAGKKRPECAVKVTCPLRDEDKIGGLGVSRAAWRAHTRISDDPRDIGGIGICVSGGGIRSATFTFGALEALREVVTEAQWLVSVSGGGYAAGAMRLALQPGKSAAESARSIAKSADVYGAGSSELDYTRRHGRYLADGAGEWLKLAATVLRGFLINILLLGLLVWIAARVLAHGYSLISFDLRLRSPAFVVQPGVWWAIGALVGGWLLVWTLSVLFESPRRKAESSQGEPESLRHKLIGMLQLAAPWMLRIAGVVTLTGLVLPLLAWVSANPPWGAMALKGQGLLSVLAGYVAALIALGKRPSVRSAVGKEVKRVRGWWRTAGLGGRNIVATAVVYLGLLALIAGFVMLFGAVLANTGAPSSASSLPLRPPEWFWTLVLAAVLCIVARVDQVHWSLHPFYRQRLASAFAVRRMCRDDRVQAEPYNFDETTKLDKYGERKPDFPEVIFSCAAHVSGDLTPPGRRVVPWTMSATRVGGQIHGWVPTDKLYEAVSATIQRDLTVQAAQAISGAAIASQMGVLQHAYTKLLTLSNIRLGSWLPNPAYLDSLHFKQPPKPSWVVPRLPTKRGIMTLVRELVGSFPADGPLVYVTDGGHYENLGLVELLRRRPATVYCVDASGDHGGVPKTLAEAIQLAREELGVEIDFYNAAALGAGPDQPPPVTPADPLTACLMHRFAQTSVITGTITYPDLGPDYPRSTAKIIFGKAVITPNTPFPLLAYASRNPAFPSDSTSDQWFDASQFDAYHSLGRHIGAIMLKRLPVLAPIVPNGSSAGVLDRPEQQSPSLNGEMHSDAPAGPMAAGGAVPSERGSRE